MLRIVKSGKSLEDDTGNENNLILLNEKEQLSFEK